MLQNLHMRMRTTWKLKREAASAKSAVILKENSATAKEMLDHARLFIHLDFAYLVALGAAITTLKVDPYELVRLAVVFQVVSIAFFLVLLTDVFVYSRLYSRWAPTLGPVSQSIPEWLFRSLSSSQPYLHFIFVLLALGSLAAYSRGTFEAREEFSAMATIQDGVDNYLLENKKVPASVDILTVNRRVHRAIERLGGSAAIRLRADGQEKYILTFAGRDGEFGTDDDDAVSGLVSLRDVLSTLKKEAKE